MRASGVLQERQSGFDAFAAMGDARPFLDTIHQRESHWIETLFDAPEEDCSQALAAELDRAVDGT